MTSPTGPRALASLAGLAAAAMSSCIFLVDDAVDDAVDDGAGGAGASVQSVTGSSQGGGGEAAGGLGGAGGGGGGGAPAACTATLAQVSTGDYPKSVAMALGPTGVTQLDLYFVGESARTAVAVNSSDLEATSYTTTETFLIGQIPSYELTISPHPDGGALIAHGPVARVEFTGAQPLTRTDVWDGAAEPILEAVEAGGAYYGRGLNGGIVDLSNAALPQIVPGPIAKLRASGNTIVWATPSGTVARCTASNCAGTTVTSNLPSGNTTRDFDTLGYAPTSKRYVTRASNGPELAVYTGLLDSGIPPASRAAALLDEPPFDDVIAMAVGGEHVFVLTADQLYPCCIDSLVGNEPCGAPVTIPTAGFSKITAYGGRVVVQKVDEGPYTMISYDVQ